MTRKPMWHYMSQHTCGKGCVIYMPETPSPPMKQFKVRIEGFSNTWHAIEIWLQAPSIIDAGNDVMQSLIGTGFGIDTTHITKLIEVGEPH